MTGGKFIIPLIHPGDLSIADAGVEAFSAAALTTANRSARKTPRFTASLHKNKELILFVVRYEHTPGTYDV
jgi:hypothetical protein